MKPPRVLPHLWPLFSLLLVLLWPGRVRADEPAKVDVGVYINNLQEVSFRDSKYTLDFFIWFRWHAEGKLQDYKPLESFEIVNGKVENKSSIDEKKIGEVQYASARITATMNEAWQLRGFPFDQHRVTIKLEDSTHEAQSLRFVEDRTNSRIGDEVRLAGWHLDGFTSAVNDHRYKSNYGDISLPRDAESHYSRYEFSFGLERDGYGVAFKILSIVMLSTLVAFVAFLVKPTDLDPRFGLGVGSLFAVAASEFIVSSSVPDSGVMTLADQVHMLSMGMIFLSLLQSAGSLKLYVRQREELADRIDTWCAVAFPVAFLLIVAAMAVHATRA